MAGCSKNMGRMPNPADMLSEDLLVEILSRVPYKSLCGSKCVSRRWRGVISRPDHRKVLAGYHLDVLAGFLHWSYDGNLDQSVHYFTSVSVGGRPPIDPFLSFLHKCHQFNILDSCNGLLLCRCFETIDSESFNYVACNPATEKWVTLPGWFDKMQTARLGFDPAVSSCFHVFQFVEDGALNVDDGDDDNSYGHVKGVAIYSSKTGVWSHKDSGWDIDIRLVGDLKSVFVNGVL